MSRSKNFLFSTLPVEALAEDLPVEAEVEAFTEVEALVEVDVFTEADADRDGVAFPEADEIESAFLEANALPELDGDGVALPEADLDVFTEADADEDGVALPKTDTDGDALPEVDGDGDALPDLHALTTEDVAFTDVSTLRIFSTGWLLYTIADMSRQE